MSLLPQDGPLAASVAPKYAEAPVEGAFSLGSTGGSKGPPPDTTCPDPGQPGGPSAEILEQLNVVMGHSAVAMALLDLQGRFVQVNRTVCELLATEREELLGQLFHTVTHPSDLAEDLTNLRRMLSGELESYHAEKRYLRKDGRVIWALTSVALARKPNGEPSHFIAQVQDITQRKEAEDRIAIQAAALKAAANGIVITDREGLVEWVNDAFCRMTGFGPEEVMGKKTSVLRSGEHGADFYRQMWETILAGKVWHGELVNRRRDGTPYHEEMTITPVHDRNCRLTHFIAIKQDITERKQAQNQMLRTQRLESIGTLAGGIAHDLNNSLAPILMCVELLKMQYPDADKVLDTVEASARRAAGMVRQLVTFAKGADGQRMLVQPRHLLKEMTKIIRSTFPKNITVKCEYPPDLPAVLGDTTQLHQVLLNLCVNARDALRAGGTIQLFGTVEHVEQPACAFNPEAQPGDYVVLSVRDTGTGIRPEVLDRMWEPFFTTKGPEKGTGLGLSTVMGIARGHGGFVRVTSELGEGACFSVYLPAHAHASFGTEFIEKPETDFQGEHQLILVVDDEADVRNVTRSVLERLNFKVVTACDGAEGLVRAADHREEIDLVVTDLQMPHLDGLSLVRALRRMLPQTGIVVACGKLEDAEEHELRGLGVSVFLEKPFTEGHLKQALKAALPTRL